MSKIQVFTSHTIAKEELPGWVSWWEDGTDSDEVEEVGAPRPHMGFCRGLGYFFLGCLFPSWGLCRGLGFGLGVCWGLTLALWWGWGLDWALDLGFGCRWHLLCHRQPLVFLFFRVGSRSPCIGPAEKNESQP